MDINLQHEIRRVLEVGDSFSVATETERRLQFLTQYLLETGLKGYVLGISGGVDSTTAGRLAQLACERVRQMGKPATFVAMRLPYGSQKDEQEAQEALNFISPDRILTVNIKNGTDNLWEELLAAGMQVPDQRSDFVKGNLKARARMLAQFAVSGAQNLAVIGTDHAAEALVGFYTKFGDGAADLTPLSGLYKSQVRAIAAHLGAPDNLVNKTPTADLEDDKPLQPDEIALGITYQQIDAYLAGDTVAAEVEAKILRWYHSSAHKRALPVTPKQWENRH